ncbi:hypothetical protein [Paenibacillus mucilaginosus]|uniref:hypothetical protein n=1 Tax=Paenibacillus mucilaginosus TaxID=61624 RepID=UPI001EF10A6B|nr:hypothetical protein [Paenibacillus mucilaginosus]MCG7215045.1 hypothetical protein [Paenibacillus mucilaginosus]WDM27146.1 hypothetical protein KCX80_32925 [Paenibacillus mucilaginosus]
MPSGSRAAGHSGLAERKRDAGEAASGTASLRELASVPSGSRAVRRGSAGWLSAGGTQAKPRQARLACESWRACRAGDGLQGVAGWLSASGTQAKLSQARLACESWPACRACRAGAGLQGIAGWLSASRTQAKQHQARLACENWPASRAGAGLRGVAG